MSEPMDDDFNKLVARSLEEAKRIKPLIEAKEQPPEEKSFILKICEDLIYILEKVVAERGKGIEAESRVELTKALMNVLGGLRKNCTSLDPYFASKLNGTALNTLTKLKPKKKDIDVDPMTGNATVKRGNFTLTFTEFTKIAGLKTSTHQLLDALMIQRTEHGGKDLTIRLKLDEFIEMRGLKDRKEARKQVDADLETLFNARLSWTENTGRGKRKDYYDMRLLSAKGIEKGVITATLTPEFAQVLEGYYPMPYAKQTLRLSGKYNPNSYYFLNCIQQHKNMNICKKNENLISVQTLLDATPDIPTYEEIAEKNRRYQELIIEPFERDMDALDNTLTWEYCHSNGEPLTDEELENMDYYIFEKLLIQTYWRTYPDQTERLERKFRRIMEAKGKKKKKSLTRQTEGG